MEGFEEKPEDIIVTNLDQSFHGDGGYIDIFSVKQNTITNEDNLMYEYSFYSYINIDLLNNREIHFNIVSKEILEDPFFIGKINPLRSL